jgi:predicted dehydrogenase
VEVVRVDVAIRIGLIGCGAIAQLSHIRYLQEHDERFRLLALSDSNPAVLDEVARRFGIDRRYPDYRALLEQTDIDAVVICHAGSHHDSILAALEAKKDIFVEKPVAWNLREVREVAERVSRSPQIVQVGYHKLYDPGFAYARDQVRKMRDLGFVRITVLHPTNELGLSTHRIRKGGGVIVEGHVDPGDWSHQVALQREAFTGGALAPLVDEALGERRNDPKLRLAFGHLTVSLIHQICTLFRFLGEPARVSSAACWREGMSIHLLVEYPNDVRCTMDWHFLSHLKDYREEYAFYGNFDRVLLRLPSPYLLNAPSPVIVQGGDGELAWEKRVVVSHEEAFRNELLAFHANVTQRRRPATTVEDALAHARFIQQVIDVMR